MFYEVSVIDVGSWWLPAATEAESQWGGSTALEAKPDGNNIPITNYLRPSKQKDGGNAGRGDKSDDQENDGDQGGEIVQLWWLQGPVNEDFLAPERIFGTVIVERPDGPPPDELEP